jgi:hypothetical protein
MIRFLRVVTEDPKGAMTQKPSTTLPGTVEKIIKSPFPGEPEKAQIAVEGADHLYKELRVENNLTDENGVDVQLKEGAKVEVTVQAKPDDTRAKTDEGLMIFGQKKASRLETSKSASEAT